MSRKAARYLAFDALKGLKESIVSAEELTIKQKFPNVSEEHKNEMDIVLYKSYLRKEAIYISYYYKGKIKTVCDIVCKIDAVNCKISLMIHGSLYMASITDLSFKEELT